jgi:hypothetical protein
MPAPAKQRSDNSTTSNARPRRLVSLSDAADYISSSSSCPASCR